MDVFGFSPSTLGCRRVICNTKPCHVTASCHFTPAICCNQSIPILFSLCTRTFSYRLGVAISLFSGVSLAFGTSFVCFPLDSTSTLLRTTATRRRTTAPICPVGPLTWNIPLEINPDGVVPLQIVEGHYLFSTKWVGLDDGISTKWSAQRKQYKMTGHLHKQVILDEERNLMLYRSCSGGTCPCIKTKAHFVDMLRVTPIWDSRSPLQTE